MAIYQTIRLGRLTMREDFTVAEQMDDTSRVMSLTGRESMGIMGKRSREQVEQRREDVLGLSGAFVPVTFTEKRNLNGFYQVQSANATLTNWDDYWTIMDWSVELLRIGSDSEVDIESRLSGAITRVNDFGVVGQRCHAPAAGAKAYWAGNVAPIYASRVGEEGEVRLYMDLGDDVNPRWGVDILDYEKGRARFLDEHGLERSGTTANVDPANWELSNSLVRVRPRAGTTFEVGTWVNGTWYTKDWNLWYGTSPVTIAEAPDFVSVLDNDYASVTIRLTWSLEPVGRMHADLTLRRGSTFVEMIVNHEFSTTLTFGLATPEAGTAALGFISASQPDENGLSYIVGSALSFTGDNVAGTISKASTAYLDVVFGVSIDENAGNAPDFLYVQYLGQPAELTRGVKR